MVRYHLYHYFVPVDGARCMVVTFGHLHSRWPGLNWITRRMGWFVRKKITSTIDEDAWLLKNIADYDTDISGMKLSRVRQGARVDPRAARTDLRRRRIGNTRGGRTWASS